MKIKHKLLSDYQYVSPDKKIFLIKSGTVVEEYCYKLKGELIPLDKDIIEMNPQIFELIDWKAELMSFMKANKMPQPAQLGKKLIPFFEEMIMSSIQQNSNNIDVSSVREIERKENEIYSLKRDIERRELDIESRERRIKDKEDDLDVRLSRVEKRENEYKEDLKNLQKKDDELRAKNKELTNKELDAQDKLNELNEKERNLDRNILSSSKEIDEKYNSLQKKIDSDLLNLSNREKELEKGFKKLKELEEKFEKDSNLINEKNKSKIYSELENELRGIENEIRNLDSISDKLTKLETGIQATPDTIMVNYASLLSISKEIKTSISKLRERVDNNIFK